MTEQEAIEILKSIEVLSFRDIKRKYFMRDAWEAQKVAIKALEQGDVLNKIVAEIIQIPTISSNKNDIYKADVIAIINKYKEESEE